MTTINPALNRSGYATLSAILGAGIWLALLVGRLAGNESLGLIELLLLLAILVFVPLGFDLTSTPDETGGNAAVFRLARFMQPFGSVMAAASFLVPVGFWGGMFASVWFGVAGLMALFGIARVLRRRKLLIEEFCIDSALLYLPVGAAWLLATRVGIAPLGFGGVIAILTAVHFHYAGFIAPVIVGMTGRLLKSREGRTGIIYRAAATGVITGPPLVALGITLSSAMEVVAATVLAICLTAHAGVLMVAVLPSIAPPRARIFLGIAALASVAAMLFACMYAIGSFTQQSFITIPQMALTHGCLNAVFALFGILGWGIIRPKAKSE